MPLISSLFFGLNSSHEKFVVSNTGVNGSIIENKILCLEKTLSKFLVFIDFDKSLFNSIFLKALKTLGPFIIKLFNRSFGFLKRNIAIN